MSPPRTAGERRRGERGCSITWSVGAATLLALGASGLGCSIATRTAVSRAETEGSERTAEPRPEVGTEAPPEPVRSGAQDRPLQWIEGYRVAPFGEVPEGIFSAPGASFAGGEAYLARGHWYYPTPEGWVWFVDVPPELRACGLALRRQESPATHPSGGYPPPPPPGCPAE
jgi:hypothetical protein